MKTAVAVILVAAYVFAVPSVAAPVDSIDSVDQILGEQAPLAEPHTVPKRHCYQIFQDMVNEGKEPTSGIYNIRPTTMGGQIPAYCDMTLQGGGWTVIAKRSDGSENFDRAWEDYVTGFGKFDTEFFMGLDVIHALTSKEDMELWIGLGSHDKVRLPFTPVSQVYKFARYGLFKVGGPNEQYALTIDDFDKTSTAGDSLSSHNGMKFSTKDRDNDIHKTKHCAEENNGGWWFYKCHDSNLNGVWKEGGSDDRNPHAKNGIVWQSWRGEEYSLKNVTIAIRPVQQ